MSESEVPIVVREFLQEHLQSYDHLEVLLLLLRDPTRTWVAEEVAAELRIDPASASTALDHLVSRGLLETQAVGGATYRYRPTTPSLEAGAAALAEAYESNRLNVMILLSDNALKRLRLSALRTFAEAFRLRRTKGDL